MIMTASVPYAKVITVGSGKQYISVSLAVKGNVPLHEDLYVLVEMPTGSLSGSDQVDPSAIGGFNGYKVILKGFKKIPSVTAYIEDEAVDEWDGQIFHEVYANIKSLAFIEGRTDFTNTTYYAKDHLGSTRMAVLTETRSPREMAAFYSFGNRKQLLTSSNPVREKFTGKEFDSEMGLSYFGARYYDADLGGWISPDPGRQFDSPYAYSGSGVNPIIGSDADGREVYLQWHGVAGGKQHCLLRIEPRNAENWKGFTGDKGFFTIGAGPSGLPPTLGNLAHGFDRPKDVGVQPKNGSILIPTPEQFISEDEFIYNLMDASLAYEDNENYELFPDKKKDWGYNSNSFISGLLKAFNIQTKPSVESSKTPGWDKPLPPSDFKK